MRIATASCHVSRIVDGCVSGWSASRLYGGNTAQAATAYRGATVLLGGTRLGGARGERSVSREPRPHERDVVLS